MSETTETSVTQPRRSRAVFSNEDFDLMKIAIGHYLQVVKDKPEATNTRTFITGWGKSRRLKHHAASISRPAIASRSDGRISMPTRALS